MASIHSFTGFSDVSGAEINGFLLIHIYRAGARLRAQAASFRTAGGDQKNFSVFHGFVLGDFTRETSFGKAYPTLSVIRYISGEK